MKFSVLLYATSIVVQLTGFRSVDALSYFDEVAAISSWAGCAKRFSVVSIVLSALVLYYFPDSRHYARTACNVAIDLVANTLKAVLSSAFSNESCDPIEPAASHYSDRSLLGLAKNPAVSDILRDQSFDSSNPRRRHRAKQEPRMQDDDKTRGHGRKKHRNSGCSDVTREGKSRQRSSREPDRRRSIGRASDDAEIGSSRDRLCRLDARKDESSPKFSTSFVTSSLGIARSNVAEVRATLERDNELPPSVGTVYRERCKDGRSVDSLDSRIKGHGMYDPLERATDGSSSHDRASTVDKDRDCEDQDEDEEIEEPDRGSGIPPRDAGNSAALPPAEGDPSNRVDEETFATRRVYFQRKGGDKGWRETADDDDYGSPNIGSERVLNRLGDQIAKLEMTVKMMKPESGNRKHRASSNEDDNVLRSVETLLEDMKRSFSKMDEDRPSVCGNPSVGSRADERNWLEPQPRGVNRFDDETTFRNHRTDYPAFDVDEEASPNQLPREEDSAASLPENSAAMRSETLLDYEEEIAPMMTNRVKPYLVRTFDWLFTGCPGASSKRHSVGKDGSGRGASERDL